MANYNLTQTGAEIQVILDRVASGYIYMGTADLTITPDTTNPNVCYLLTAVGTYTNFGNITHSSGITIALWNGSAWSAQNVPSAAVVETDATPTENSIKPVQSGGVLNAITNATSGITHDDTNDGDSEIIFEDNEETAAKINGNGIYSKKYYDLDGNEFAGVNYESHSVLNYASLIGTTPYTQPSSDPSSPRYQNTNVGAHIVQVEDNAISAKKGANYSTYFSSTNIAFCLRLNGLVAGKQYRFTGHFENISTAPFLKLNITNKSLGNSWDEYVFTLDSGVSDDGDYSLTFVAYTPFIYLYIPAQGLTDDYKVFVSGISISLVGDSAYEYIEPEQVRNLDEGAFSELFLNKHGELTDSPTKYVGNEIRAFNTCLCIGDSVTAGSINTTDEQGAVGPNVPSVQYMSYPSKLSEMTDIDIDVLATGGVTFETWYSQYGTNDMSGHEMAIIFLGINNQTWDSSAQTALGNIITKLKNDNSNTAHNGNFIKIFIVNGINTISYGGYRKNEVNEGIEDYIDGLNDPDVILLDLKQYGNMCSYAYECGHPNALGYYQLAEDLYRYISWYIHNNKDDFRYIQFIGTDYVYTN